MFFKVFRVFVLLTLGIVFASCSGLAIQVAFDLDGPVLLNDQEDMILGANQYSIRFDEAIKKVGSPKTPITMKLSTTTTSGTNVTGISASTTESDPTQLDISFTSPPSFSVGDTITITIPEGYLTDEADNPNLEIEHKVTVVQGTKSDLNTLTLTYAEVTTTEGASYTSSAPTWAGNAPTNITYSITAKNVPGSDGSGNTVVIAPTTGKITITADAIPDNSGTYTVTATASENSNYADTTEQTTTVTVKVKGNLNSYSLSYPIAKHSTDGSISVSPVWRKGTTEVAAPAGVSYSDTSNPLLSAIGFTLNTTNGTISGNINIPSPAMPKVTAYQITATGNDTDYAGSTTGTFLDTFPLGVAYTPTTTGTAVSTVDELKAITQNLAGEYYLTNHIDLSTETSWTPIASSASPFTGKLHGNGYAIYNLTINAPSATHQGLFASVSGATIENLGIGVTSITGLAGVGALASVAKENASLDNIAVVPMTTATKIVATGSTAIEGGASTDTLLGGLVGLQMSGSLMGYSLVPVEGTGNKVGGLVGESNDGGTVNGFTTGAVTGTGSKVGGLVGESNNATVNGFTTGAVTVTGNNVGGLVGFNDTGTVSGHAMGAVSGKDYTGGLVGQSTAGGTVSGYATGAVTGATNVGGLVGASSGTVTGYTTGVVSGTTNSVGGLVGYNSSTVSGYATGAVSGKASVGGLVGYNQSGTTTVGYATGAVSGTDSNSVGGLVGSNGSNPVNGYWDIQSTKQATSEGGSTAVGISATKNIVFNDTTGTYTDLNNSNTIFNITAFTAIFDTANGANKTWPKLKNFPFPQPTVTVSASDENIIEVTPPEVAQSPE